MTRRKEQRNPSQRFATEGMSKNEYIRVRNGRNILQQLFEQGIPSSALIDRIVDVSLPSDTPGEIKPEYPDGKKEHTRYEVLRVLDILRDSIRKDSDLKHIRLIHSENHPHGAQLEAILSAGLTVYVKVVPNVHTLNWYFGELREKWQIMGKLSSRLAREKLIVLLFNEEETTETMLRTNFFKFAAYVIKKNDPRNVQYPDD